MTDVTEPAVRTESAWKIFSQKAEEVQAVRDVTITINRGIGWPLGLWKDHALEPDRRPDEAHARPHLGRGSGGEHDVEPRARTAEA